jgi:hypothetical protein
MISHESFNFVVLNVVLIWFLGWGILGLGGSVIIRH